MVRWFVIVIVGLLTFGASGLASLIADEPCTGYEQPASKDAACSPTCVTCGCCAQAAEPVVVPVTSSLEAPVADVSPLIPHLTKISPRDILHVPRLLSA